VSRDNQFAGWAKAVLDAIGRDAGWAEYAPLPPGRYVIGTDEWERTVQCVLARAGYDLVHHAIDSIEEADLLLASGEICVAKIPDLSVLPEGSKQ